jgi:nitrous oxidase accessory protein NosD
MMHLRRLFALVCALTGVIMLNIVSVAGAGASGTRTIVVGPGQSIQAAINAASPGDTVLMEPGTYAQSVSIRTDGITLRGSGNGRGGTLLVPPPTPPATLCNQAFGPTGVCILAKKLNVSTGAVVEQVYNDAVTDLSVTGFSSNGVFGYGTYGMTVTNVTAVNDGYYGIARFVSSKTLFANDVAVGNLEAGFYVGDSPDAATVVRDNTASGNQFGIFVRHARGVDVVENQATGNCQGILVLDDGQSGGAGNAVIRANGVFHNNKFCPSSGGGPNLKGGGILLLGATETQVVGNAVADNQGKQKNSGGIVVISAAHTRHGGSDPNFDTIANNTAYGDQPADLIWDGTGVGVTFSANHCTASLPTGLCH